MQRRDLLRAFGAATALAFVPHDAIAAWARVASGIRPAGGLSDAHLALVGAIADTILPRTDSPSASDVNVPAFVDVVVSENYSDAERATFVAGLDTLNAWRTVAVAQEDSSGRAGRDSRPFAELSPGERGSVVEGVEHLPRGEEPSRTYWRLKGLVIHGYFTSERVAKDVLHVQVMPGRFEGSAPFPTKSASSSSREMHHDA